MQSSMVEQEQTNQNTQWHVSKVRSIHGKSRYFCKECQADVQVAEHVTGITREDDYNIYWNFVNGECGHCLEDWSH